VFRFRLRGFVDMAFGKVGIEIEWEGEGVDEVGVEAATGDVLIAIDPRYYRPTEVELLLGDPTKAKEKLGWEAKVGLRELVKMMVEGDLGKL